MTTLEEILHLIRMQDMCVSFMIGASIRIDYVANDMRSVYDRYKKDFEYFETKIKSYPHEWVEAAKTVKYLRSI